MTKRKNHIEYIDLGVMDYRQALDYQEDLFNRIVEFKRGEGKTDRPGQYLLTCEHPHVYTLGKSGDEANLLIRKDFLRKIKATYYRTNRGGDITYHGPGQVVGYPILDLEVLGIGLKQYVTLLEDAIIDLLETYDIISSPMNGATGVWLDANHPAKARKICAIGIRSSRHVTMHGFALNVNTNLDYFSYINPCGFETKGVTSMAGELKEAVDIEQVKLELSQILIRRLLSQGPSAGA